MLHLNISVQVCWHKYKCIQRCNWISFDNSIVHLRQILCIAEFDKYPEKIKDN